MSEQRTILVANTKTQKRYKISTNASTLGELKSVLHDNGIDYADMSFTEGITKSVLTDDNAPLPTDIPYKGNTTNNLVLLLTNTAKKVSSGLNTERFSLYKKLKEKGLEQAIKDTFGRNFTQVSTDDLSKFVKGQGRKAAVTGTILEETDMDDSFEDERKVPLEEDIDIIVSIVGKLVDIEESLNSLLEKWQ